VLDLVADINQALHDAGVDNRVEAKKIGNTNGIMLRTKDPLLNVKMLQVVDADATTEENLGFQDMQIAAEIAVAGENALIVQGTSLGDSFDGTTADNVSFRFSVDGGSNITVDLLATDTADNTKIGDLVDDLNNAIAAKTLPNGQSLGTVISAGAIDTNSDTDSSLTSDTIVFRSTANISTFSLIQATHTGEIGFGADQTAHHIGPNANGSLPGSGAEFVISLGDQQPQPVSISQSDTTDNAAAPDLWPPLWRIFRTPLMSPCPPPSMADRRRPFRRPHRHHRPRR